MGFFSGLFSAAVKTALTPVAIIKDSVNIAMGEEPEATKTLLESASEDANEAIDDLADGEM